MKSTDLRMESTNAQLNNENTLVVRPGKNFATVTKPELKKLDADGKTVIITDPHLFPKKRDNDYKNRLLDVLESLKCKEIIYTHKPDDSGLFQNIVAELAKKGILLKKIKATTSIHDRYWICRETEKGINIGTSLNGMEKSLCCINEMPKADLQEILTILKNENVIGE